MSYKHCDQDFRTKHKVFILQITDYGQSIRITERNRVASFDVNLDLGGAFWLMEVVSQAADAKKDGAFLRKYKGSSYVLVVEVKRNSKGEFLKVMRINRGEVKNVIIPGEENKKGWRDLSRCLENFFCKKSQTSKNKTLMRKDFTRAAAKHQGILDVREEKRWERAVVAYRDWMEEGWTEISKGLSEKLERKVRVSPLFADRAILWCQSDYERDTLVKEGSVHIRNQHAITIKRWCIETHWKNVKIEGRASWIGIEVLPLHMWNSHTFNVIGNKLGGLLNMADDTAWLEFLPYAKIQVKGMTKGFIPSTMEIRCWGKRTLGFFNLDNNMKPKVAEGFRGAWTSRWCMEVEDDELESSDDVDAKCTKHIDKELNSTNMVGVTEYGRFLYSSGFGESFNFLRQEAIVRCVSDHCFIVLSTDPPNWGPMPFRFENIWLEHKRFKKDLEVWWREETGQGWAGYKFMRKLKNIRGRLKISKKEVFGDTRVEKLIKSKRIAEIDHVEGSPEWSMELDEERAKLKEEWSELLLRC
ncbi:hypothetical protein L484_025093 [Morus notabilis]|uniref:Uncharacterized protein n=1 Tax=Morus notabilis TaxID=981085 RepID=W9RAT1_9ROSA|nr:hypothetical protein L484_025093 [Morus notabilis]